MLRTEKGEICPLWQPIVPSSCGKALPGLISRAEARSHSNSGTQLLSVHLKAWAILAAYLHGLTFCSILSAKINKKKKEIRCLEGFGDLNLLLFLFPKNPQENK